MKINVNLLITLLLILIFIVVSYIFYDYNYQNINKEKINSNNSKKNFKKKKSKKKINKNNIFNNSNNDNSTDNINNNIYDNSNNDNSTDNINNNVNLSLINYSDLNINQKNIIHEIWHTCFPELNDTEELDMGFFSKTLLWILKNNNNIIGYCCTLESMDFIEYLNKIGITNHDLYSIKNWNGIFINNFCILPQFRKNGHANKILNIIQDYYKKNNKDYLHLLVNSDNLPAYNLYLKNEFEKDQENINSETNIKVYTMIKYFNEKIKNENKLPEYHSKVHF